MLQYATQSVVGSSLYHFRFFSVLLGKCLDYFEIRFYVGTIRGLLWDPRRDKLRLEKTFAKPNLGGSLRPRTQSSQNM